MKKAALVMVIVTLLFCAFSVGYFLGRSTGKTVIQLSTIATAPPTEEPSDLTNPTTETHAFPLNINTATAQELTLLPGIGETLASRIVSYRDTHGSFETLAELLNVEGLGEKKLETILDYITIGG